jgi:hypothetical protein
MGFPRHAPWNSNKPYEFAHASLDWYSLHHCIPRSTGFSAYPHTPLQQVQVMTVTNHTGSRGYVGFYFITSEFSDLLNILGTIIRKFFEKF